MLASARLPLTRWTLVNEDHILAQLDAIWTNLPVAIEQALAVLHEKQRILDDAEAYAQETIQLAERRAAQMLDETAIVRQAEREAEQVREAVRQECLQIRQQSQQDNRKLREQTLEECARLRGDADEYATSVLTNIERQLGEMLRVTRNGRDTLARGQQSSPAASAKQPQQPQRRSPKSRPE